VGETDLLSFWEQRLYLLLGLRSPPCSQSREMRRDVYSKRREQEAAAKTPGSAGSTRLRVRRSDSRQKASACQSHLENIFPATYLRARAYHKGRGSISAPAGKERAQDKNECSFQRPPRSRTHCCVAWRRHLQEEMSARIQQTLRRVQKGFKAGSFAS